MPLINGIAAGSDQNVGLLRMGAQRYRAYLGETLVYGDSDFALPPGAGKILTDAANPIALSESTQTSFTVWLDRRPISSVRLNVTLAEHPRDPITLVTAARMRFTRGNWNTPQTVTIEANDVPDVTDLYTSLTITGPEDQILNSVTRQIRVRNDDLLVPRLELDKTSLELGTGGDVDSFRVRLTVAPSANVDVAFSALTNASTSPTSLTFTPTSATEWKTVTVTSGDNVGMETLTLTPSGGNVDGVAKTVDISIATQAQVVISPDSLTLLEGETKEIQVRVINAPEDYVVLIQVDEASPLIYAGPQVLTFTDARAQVVHVTALEDVLVGNQDGAAQVRFILSGGGDNFTKVLPVAVVNIGSAPLLSASPTYLPMDAESTAAVAVKLTSRPYADVTVSATLPTRAGTLSASELTFTSDNWNTAQELTITAVALAAGDNDVLAELKLVGSGGGVTDTAVVSVLVAATGALKSSLVVSTTAISVVAGSSTQIFTSLNSAPVLRTTLGQAVTGEIEVAIASDDAGVTVIPASLTFDGDNWETPVGVTIDAASASAGDSASVTLTPSGASSDGMARSVAVTVVATGSEGVTTMDGETELPRFARKTPSNALTLAPGGPYIGEFYVLTRAPAAPVEIQVSKATAAGLMQVGFPHSTNPVVLLNDPVTLRFDKDNYKSGLRLYARATSEANQTTGLLQYSVTEGKLASDAGFITLFLREPIDTTGGVLPVFSVSSISMMEGETRTVGLSLSRQPEDIIRVAVNETSVRLDLSATPTLYFSPKNWDTPQDVTIAAPYRDPVTPENQHRAPPRRNNIYAWAQGPNTPSVPGVLQVHTTPATEEEKVVVQNLNVVYSYDRRGQRISFLTWDRRFLRGQDGSFRLNEYYVASYATYTNGVRGATIETRETVNQESIHLQVAAGIPYIATVMRRGEPDSEASLIFTVPIIA